jgi:Conserved hypothetical protein 2217 (DUF2460)
MSFIEYPSPTPVFPASAPVSFPVHKKPTFGEWQHRSVTGKQYQTARQVYPNWEFDLTFEVLREQTQNIALYVPNTPFVELEAVSQLFLSCYGKYGEFYFNDLEDNSRLGQFVGVGNAVQTKFRIYRTWGLSPLDRLEPVGGVNLGATINVYYNSLAPPVTDTWIVTNEPTGSFITFALPPGHTDGGHLFPWAPVITMDFSFYYRCRFKEDEQQYEQFLYNLHTLKKCSFVSVKP